MSNQNTLTWDLETYSEVDLKLHGSEVYARHPSTEILLFCYRLPGSSQHQTWDCTTGAPMPWLLSEALHDPAIIKRGANSMRFDTAVLRETLGINIPYEEQEDVLVRAARYNLPTGLDRLGRCLGLAEDEAKDKGGKALIKLFCCPLAANSKWRKKGYTRACKETHPEEWAAFIAYGEQDTATTDNCAERLPVWNDTATEDRILWLDMAINNRGIRIDRQYVEQACILLEKIKREVEQYIRGITGGIVPAQHAQFKKWLQKQMPGRPITSTDKAAVKELLEDVALPGIVRKVLELSGSTTSTSIAKFPKMLAYALETDDRMYHLIKYGGAGCTMRWAGSGPQPHNIPRPLHNEWLIDLFIRYTTAGRGEQVGNWLRVAVSAIRGAIVPGPGKRFVNADYSSIEGRVLAFVSGEQTVLDAYHDGKNLYLLNGEIFGHDYDTMKKFKSSHDPVEYNIYMVCKVMELAMGYQGGVGAFVSMAKNYGLDCDNMAKLLDEGDLVPEKYLHQANKLYHNPKFQKQVKSAGLCHHTWVYIDAVKRMWRERRPQTATFWRKIDECVRHALENPGIEYTCGANGMISCEYSLDHDMLGIRLPSGRVLSYLWPKISGGKKDADSEDDVEMDEFNPADHEVEVELDEHGNEVIRYRKKKDDDTIISYYSPTEKGLTKTYSHGGKFTNNIVQGIARDLLANGLLTLEEYGWFVMLHIHDEALAEVDIDDEERTPELMCKHLCIKPLWGLGIPLVAEGQYRLRFAK